MSSHRRSAWVCAWLLGMIGLLAATSAAYAQQPEPETARDMGDMQPESARDEQVMVPESARDEQEMVPETAMDERPKR